MALVRGSLVAVAKVVGNRDNRSFAMLFKHNASRRHRIGKMKFKVTNWAEYEGGLRRRGSLSLWISPEAMSGQRARRSVAD
jgi:hypothetical protein